MESMRHDFNVRINDPSIAADWVAACKRCDDAEDAMIAELRAIGVKGARPDDGHVDREKNYFAPAYEWFNDGVRAGDNYALGHPGQVRLVHIDRIADAGGLLRGYMRYWFTPRQCRTCACNVCTTMRPWPNADSAWWELCATCAADVDRSRTVPLACQKKAPRWSAQLARWLRKWLPVLAACALLPAYACAEGQTNDTHMYDPEYFPTPRHVISQMLEPYRVKTDVGRYSNDALAHLTILDPSAGSGALLTYIDELFVGSERPVLHAIEINPDMQPVLREKFTLVHDDFLTFQTDVRYDLIVMNPPFSNGDAHLEKAWNVLHSGDIVCLLNAETVRNPYTERRTWLTKLIADHGSVEYLGAAFARSQRPTNVEVALVRLKKTDTAGGFDFWEQEDFQPEERDFAFNEETMGDLPAVNDKISAMVTQYKQSQSAFVEYLKARKRLMYYVKPLIEGKVDDLLAEAVKEPTGKACFNTFAASLQSNAWESIFHRTQLYDLMSNGVRADFAKMRQQQGGMPFTEANIHALLELLFTNRHTILQKCVEEAFDIMTSYDESNRSHWEGWKTNSAYKVNRKVIIPGWAVSYDARYGSWSTNYSRYEKWTDIDRALAMLDGKRLSSPTAMKHMAKDARPYHSGDVKLVTIRDAIERRFFELRDLKTYRHYTDNVCESEYFHIKFWKKGTVHLVFKEEALWQAFNQAAAAGKKWLPNDPGHVPTPTSEPADKRYAERLELDNAENRKLMIAA